MKATAWMALAWTLAASGSASAAWMQTFNESGVGQFDHVQLQMVAPQSFATPAGIGSFSLGGWAQTYNDGNVLIANGLSASSLNFNLSFAGAKSTPFTFYFQAWQGSVLKEEAAVNWGGTGWNIGASTAWSAPRLESAVMSSVPAPSTLLLTGCGLLAVAYVRRRRSREQRGSFG